MRGGRLVRRGSAFSSLSGCRYLLCHHRQDWFGWQLLLVLLLLGRQSIMHGLGTVDSDPFPGVCLSRQKTRFLFFENLSLSRSLCLCPCLCVKLLLQSSDCSAELLTGRGVSVKK